jgi:hypothetical protein
MNKFCHVICEMDIGYQSPGWEMKEEIFSRQAFGRSVCVFKYEREGK